MKYYSYASNIYSTDEEFNNCIVVIAVSKKEAQKWAKQFKGLIIGDKVRGKIKEIDGPVSYVMNRQKIALEVSLDKGLLYIKMED